MADNGFKINKSVNFNPQAGAPANPIDGDFYYDSTAQSFAYYHNGSWANMDSVGTVASTDPMTSTQFTPAIVRNSVIKVTGAVAPIHLAGISSSFSAKRITIYNAGSNIIVVEHENGSEATANNRIRTPTAGDMNLIAGEVAVFTYDIVANRWLLVSISSQAGAQIIATTTNPGLVTLHQASTSPPDGIVLSDGDLNTANGVVGLDANRAATIAAPTSAVTALTVTAAANANAVVINGSTGSSAALKVVRGAGDIQQWTTVTPTVLTSISNAGDLVFAAAARLVQWPTTSLREVSSGVIGFHDNTGANLWASFTKTATFGSLTLFAPPSPGQTQALILAADSAVGNVNIGNAFGSPLDLVTSNTAQWRITAAGVLQGLSGNHAIQNVLDPVNVQDAATKYYVDSNAPLSNLIINGDMQLWQRGIGPYDCNFNLNTAAWDRKFVADRWFAVEEVTTGTATTDVVAYSQVAVASENDFQYAARLRFKTNAINTPTGFIWLAQEIDRGMIRRTLGKKLSLTVKWRKGSSMVDAGRIKIIAQSGDPRNSFRGSGFGNPNNTAPSSTDPGSHPAFGAYSGTTTIMDVTVANGSIGTSMGVQTATTSVVVPTNTTGIVVLIGRALANSTADANAYLDVSRVRLIVGDSVPLEFALASNSLQGELRLCQHYCEKSQDPQTNPATSSDLGSVQFSYATGGYLGHVKFLATKFWANELESTAQRITVFSSASGTAAKAWDVNAAADKTANIDNSNQNGFQVSATGGTVDNMYRLHFIADFEI